MAKRFLLIKAKGGLGNRMLSAVCGLLFADLTGRVPLIDWRDGSYAPLGENAYPLLFKSPISRLCSSFDSRCASITPSIWQGNLATSPQEMIDNYFPRSHSNPMTYRKLCTDLKRLDSTAEIAVYWSYLPKIHQLKKHIKADPLFQGKKTQDIFSSYLEKYFTPNDWITDQVDSITANLGAISTGVHIRHTDRKVSLDKVRRALNARLQIEPHSRIFLATDNARVQAEINSEFPNVHHISKSLNTDGSRLHWPASDVDKVHEGENALVDMFALSKCNHLIYSRHSTFSVTSSYIGQLSANQLVDVDRYSPYVVTKRVVQYYL